jgi:hypothetical protein
MNQINLTFKTDAGDMMYNTANQLTSRIDTNAFTHTYVPRKMGCFIKIWLICL